MVDEYKEIYTKELKKAKFHIADLEETLSNGDKDDLQLAYERICDIYKGLDAASNKVTDAMLDEDKSLEEVRTWTQSWKTESLGIRELKGKLKQRISDMERRELREKDDDIYKKRLDFELELMRKKHEENMSKPQAVKLQKYTITPFKGDCKDWMRFWNQFQVEVDGSTISEISKLNYLLELVQGQPKEHILGLPHSPEGYAEAKKILELTYGKDNQVHKALIQDLESLPAITNIHKLKEIHDFHTKFARTVRTLATMKKLDGSQAFTYSIMDKLGPVREVIIQKDDDWEGWGLEEVVEHLRKFTDRNPLLTTNSDDSSTPKSSTEEQSTEIRRRERVMLASPPPQQPFTSQACVYCDSTDHRSKDCIKVLDIASRREILMRKRLCFNCARPGHTASQCRSRGCFKCNSKHHTSLCDKTLSTLSPECSPPRERFYSVLGVPSTVHATVIAKVNGIPARIMLDSGAGSSYISSNLLRKLNMKPTRVERRVIEQMYGTVDKQVEIYKVQIESLNFNDFSMDLQCINAEKPTLTYLPNPNVPELKSNYPHLKQLVFSDEDSNQESLPVHMILGAADLQRIKTTTAPVLGQYPDTDPGAELTRLGWIVTGKSTLPTAGDDRSFFIKSSSDEIKEMCSQEVLSDTIDNQDLCHEDYHEQIQRQDDGTYSTRLPWQPDHQDLPEHKEIALARLSSTTNKLENLQKVEDYHTITQQQLEEGILEPVPATATVKVEHCDPHQPVIQEEAESTKLRTVCDILLKNFKVLLYRFIAAVLLLCIAGGMQKALLQIPVDSDAFSLLWYDDLVNKNIVAYRFTRVNFGAGPSPYILGATLHKHVSQYVDQYPETVNELLNHAYVDDKHSGSDSKQQLLKFKKESTVTMKERGFHLHKCHPNDQQSKDSSTSKREKSAETKILGVPWNKRKDMIAVRFNICLQKVIITGKILYSEVCLKKQKWDDAVAENIKRRSVEPPVCSSSYQTGSQKDITRGSADNKAPGTRETLGGGEDTSWKAAQREEEFNQAGRRRMLLLLS